MAKIESSDPNQLTVIIKAATAQAVDILSVQDSTGAELMSVDKDGVPSGWGSGTGTGDVVGPSSATDNAVSRFDTATGKKVQNSLMTVTDAGSPNIPTGQTYKINGVSLAYGDVGAAASAHNQSATTITTGTLDGDRLPAMSTSKQGAVPLTGTPSGKYLRDDATWESPLGTAGDVFGPSGATDSAVALFDTATGKLLKDSLVTVDSAGSVDIPSGETYNIDSTPLSYSDVGAPALVHTHDGSDILTGIDGDILPAISETKAGGVPATGTPVGKYLEDDGTWSSPAGAGDVMGPGTSTNLAIPKFDGTDGDTLLDSGVTIDASNNLNIPSGSVYQIDGTNLTFTDVGAAEATHEHAGEDITSGTIDGDVLPTMSETKSGAVPPTGTPTGLYLTDEGTWESPPGGGDVTGPGASTDNAVARFDLTSGKTLQNSVMTVSDAGTVNIPTGQTYNIAGNPLDYSDVGAAAPTHDQAASTITTGTLDGDRLPALSTTKKGGVPATGTPSGLFLNDGGTWTAPTGSGCKAGASYVLYKSGSTYYAQNGSTFAIDYSGTNCATVMNSCLATDSVYIDVRPGTYTLTAPVTMNHLNQTIKGAGPGVTIFTVSGNIDGFVLSEGSASPKNFFLEDMTIDHTGTSTDARGVYMNIAMRTTLRNLVISNFNGTGALAGGIVTDANCWYMLFQTIRLQDGIYVGFRQISDDACDNGQMRFIDCEFSASHQNFIRSPITAGSFHRILFEGCQFQMPFSGHNLTHGLDLYGVDEVTCVSCDFEGSSSGNQRSVYIGGQGHSFHGCQFFCYGYANFTIVRLSSDFGSPQVNFFGCRFMTEPDNTNVVTPDWGVGFFGCWLDYGAWSTVGATIYGFGNRGRPFAFSGALSRWVVSAGVAPTLTYEGETVNWRDTTASKSYLMIRVNSATYKVECT